MSDLASSTFVHHEFVITMFLPHAYPDIAQAMRMIEKSTPHHLSIMFDVCFSPLQPTWKIIVYLESKRRTSMKKLQVEPSPTLMSSDTYQMLYANLHEQSTSRHVLQYEFANFCTIALKTIHEPIRDREVYHDILCKYCATSFLQCLDQIWPAWTFLGSRLMGTQFSTIHSTTRKRIYHFLQQTDASDSVEQTELTFFDPCIHEIICFERKNNWQYTQVLISDQCVYTAVKRFAASSMLQTLMCFVQKHLPEKDEDIYTYRRLDPISTFGLSPDGLEYHLLSSPEIRFSTFSMILNQVDSYNCEPQCHAIRFTIYHVAENDVYFQSYLLIPVTPSKETVLEFIRDTLCSYLHHATHQSHIFRSPDSM